MAKNVEYWESFERQFEDFEKEGMNLDDFLLKSKFNFHQGKFAFSSKSKFNYGKTASAKHEYSLKSKCSRSTVEFKHKAEGETSVEAEVQLKRVGDVNFSAYINTKVDQGEDRRNCDSNVQLRYLHDKYGYMSLGVDNWSCPTTAPKALTFQTSGGHTIDGSFKVQVNTYWSFSLDKKFLQLARFFIKGQQGDFTGLVLANVNRKLVDGTDEAAPKTVSQNVDLGLKFSKVIDANTKLGGSLNHDLSTSTTNAVLAASRTFDKVKVNGKVASDKSLTFGITSTFDDLTLNFAAKSSLLSATEKVGDVDTTRHWANYKFGVSAEFNRI